MRLRRWWQVLLLAYAGTQGRRLRAAALPLLGALALVLPFVVARFEHQDQHPQVTMGVAEAWLGTRGSDRLALIDGPSASFVTQVPLSPVGLDVVQAAGTVYGLDRDAGLLRTISGTTYLPAQLSVPGLDPAVQQFVSGGNLYLYPILGRRIARVATNGARAELVAGPVLPAHFRIAATGTDPAVVDLDQGTVTWYDGERKQARADVSRRLSSTVQAAGDQASGTVYLFDPADGSVISCSRSSCAPPTHPPGVAGLPAVPVIASGRLLLPDRATGAVRTVDLQTGTASTVPVFPAGTDFVLEQQQGYTFANPPGRGDAAVIAPDGTLTLVHKHPVAPESPDDPGSDDPSPASTTPPSDAPYVPDLPITPPTSSPSASGSPQPSATSGPGDATTGPTAGRATGLPASSGPTDSGPPVGPPGPGPTGTGPTTGPPGTAGPPAGPGPTTTGTADPGPTRAGPSTSDVSISVSVNELKANAHVDIHVAPEIGHTYFLLVEKPEHGFWVHAVVKASGTYPLNFDFSPEGGARNARVVSAAGADAAALQANYDEPDWSERLPVHGPPGDRVSNIDSFTLVPVATDPPETTIPPTATTSPPTTTKPPPPTTKPEPEPTTTRPPPPPTTKPPTTKPPTVPPTTKPPTTPPEPPSQPSSPPALPAISPASTSSGRRYL